MGRIRRRLLLSHVEERSTDLLRERWQRRLDRGEQVFCSNCRLRGIDTRIDPRDYRIGGVSRVPECPSCHTRDQSAHPGGMI